MMNCKKLLLSIVLFTALSRVAPAQNWQYVGAPYIQGNTGFSSFLYFGDLELEASGDILLGYWESNGDLHAAKYTGGSWTSLPVAGNFPVSNVDMEVYGSDYYLGYSGVRGANLYAFARKFNGASWDAVGDSILLGNSGSGGWFDLVLDNNGAPCILGGVSAPMADKQVHQLSGGVWSSVLTIPGSASTVFRENSGMFNAQNHLICATQGYLMSTGLVYFNVVHDIDGSNRATLGDTLFLSATNTRLHTDASGTPHLVFNYMPSARVLSYQLSGSAWSYTGGDTSVTTGQMTGADVTGDGRTVFHTLQADVDRSVYYYDNGTTNNMDSVNVTGFGVGGIQDLVVDPATSEVYILELEVKQDASSDYAVMRHTLNGTAAVEAVAADEVKIYPNPSSGTVYLQTGALSAGTICRVYNSIGMLMQELPVKGKQTELSLRGYAPGNYMLQWIGGGKAWSRMIIVR